MLKSVKLIAIILIPTSVAFVVGYWVSPSTMDIHLHVHVNDQTKRLKGEPTEHRKEDTSEKKVVPEENKTSVSLDSSSIQDTIVMDTTLIALDSNFVIPRDTSGEEILIKREKLLETISLKVRDKVKTNQSMADSLMAEDLGISNKAHKNYSIEFWQHPLNSRGYKMNGSKIVVYGLDPDHQMELVRDQRGLIFYVGAETILLKDSEQFQKFTFVSE